MAKTLNLKIDVKNLTKDKLVENNYTGKDGEVKELNAELVLVEKKQERIITTGTKKDGTPWELVETHFIAEKSAEGEESNYVGTGSQFRDVNGSQATTEAPKGTSGEMTQEDIDSLPF